MAIDLGTANTLVYIQGRGIVLNEPSVVAMTKDSRGRAQICAVGSAAKDMLGRNPDSINVVRPMKAGVIADFDTTQAMLRYFIKKTLKGVNFVKPRIVLCIPCGVTPVEKEAVRSAAKEAGAREVYLVEEPMAAAIGAGLPVSEPNGCMVVDIGGGTTEVAVISLGGIVYSKSVRVAGDRFDEAIASYVKKNHFLLIGERMAENVKISIGNAYPFDSEIKTFEIKGRDLVAAIPKSVEIDSDEIRDALSDSIAEIVETIKSCLDKTPPELIADILDNGIVLTGGGSLLANLDITIREKTGLPVLIENEPLTCVVRGCGILLESIPLLKRLAQ